METALSHLVEEQQLPDNFNKKINVINSLDNNSSSQLSMLLAVPEENAEQKDCHEWIEARKVACRNTGKYECSHSLGDVHHNRLLTQSYVEKLLLESGVYLKELSLSKICKASIMPIVAEHCKNLTSLEFVHNGALNTNPNDYIESFTKLKKLKFIKIQLIHMEWCLRRKFPYEAINYLSEEINEIHLIDKRAESKKAVFFDLERFKNLHSLTLSGCNLNKIFEGISKKTTLIYLDLTKCRLNKKFDNGYLLDELINLEHINIRNNGFTLKVYSSFLDTCKNIRHLALESYTCEDQDEITFSIKYWENLKNLEHIEIFGIFTVESANRLFKYCKKLKYVDVRRAYITDSISAMQELSKLENLECFKSNRMYDYYEEAILSISDNCKKLKILEINDSYSFRYSTLSTLPSLLLFQYLLKLQYLEQLKLPRMVVNESIEISIVAVVDKLKNLKKLDIRSFIHITETTLIALTNSESLKELNVGPLNVNVTDNFLSKLKGLTCLNCMDCRNITDAGVIQLINNCPDLEYLNIYRTSVTINTIIAASEATKNRINNIILTIAVQWIFEKSFKSINKSIWLALAVDDPNINDLY